MKKFLESTLVQNIILVAIILNSAVLGLLSLNNDFLPHAHLILIDELCLYFFIFEMCLKIVVYQKDFFKSRWNLFDFTIVAFSVIPFLADNNSLFFSENIVIFRLFRIVKVLRVFSTIPQLKFIIMVISKSVPNVLCIGALLLLVYYVYAVFGTRMFGVAMPEYFGDLGRSFFTLFQMMTGESWSEAIARPTMQIYPYAWVYFISFIIIVSFIVLNIIIGVIVNSVDEIKEQKEKSK